MTIASVYFCTVPVASAEQMHELIELHGDAGLATYAATLLLPVGLLLGFRRRGELGSCGSEWWDELRGVSAGLRTG